MRIGILHPGEMGISVAVSAIQNGHEVYWVSNGRGDKTRMRASKHELHDAGSLAGLCETASIILSICPPHAAEDVARSVIQTGFKGLYVDANAVSPQRSQAINEEMLAADIEFVDGGIIGPPAWERGKTWLYLSGPRAEDIAHCFTNGSLNTKVIGEDVGKASAIKMCYAAYTKGTSALLSTILAAAETYNVRMELSQQWDMDEAGFTEQTERRIRRVTAKAWRFAGEMDEIAATFSAASLPSGFHEAAAEIYRRMADFKDSPALPELNDVLIRVTKKRPTE